MQRKKKTREKHGSFGNKGTACGWSTENAKIIIRNKLHIFLPSPDPTAEFLHLYWHVNHKGAPKTRYLVCGPYAIPKVLTLFLRIAQNHLGQLPSLFTYAPANRAAKAKHERSSSKLLPPHHRCHVSHAPLWVRNQK